MPAALVPFEMWHQDAHICALGVPTGVAAKAVLQIALRWSCSAR